MSVSSSAALGLTVRVSLDEPEPVDSILMFLSGYDILEYSWVKATVVSVRLRILSMMLQNTNSVLQYICLYCNKKLSRCIKMVFLPPIILVGIHLFDLWQ